MSKEKINQYEFDASIPLKDVIGMQEESLKLMREQFGSKNQVVELYENTINYLKLLKNIIDDNDVFEQSNLN